MSKRSQRARDRTGWRTVVALAGSDVGSNTSSFGLSAASPNIVRRMQAYVLGDVLPAQGSGFDTPQQLLIEAIAHDDVLTYASGRASAGNLGVAASASMPRMDSEIDAYIGPGANVTVRNAGATRKLGVTVRADHSTDAFGVAGSFAGSLQQGVGAAGDVKLLDKRVHAHIDPDAMISVQDDVLVDAISHEHPDALVAGLGAALDLGVGGSVAFTKLDKETFAFIDGATVRADGNVLLRADSFTQFDPIAGAGAIGLAAGVGASGSLLMKADDTRAYITGGAVVDALATKDEVQVYTGERDGQGNRTTRNVRGVALSATNFDDVDPLAVGGAVALLAAVAGSGAGTITDNHVAAYIDAGSQVNQNDVGAAAAQLVHLMAWDDTNLRSAEGVISVGLLAAASATFDFADLGKNTEAYIGENAQVDSNSDVEIRAHSTEDVRSIGGSSALGFALVSGTLVGASQTISAETRAYTQRGARVRATDEVIVAADNDSEIEVIAAFQTVTFPGLAAGQILIADSDIGGTTEAYVDSEVDASSLDVTANADNRAVTTAALHGLHLAPINVAVIQPTAKTSLEAQAWLGGGANIAVSGALDLEAESINAATADIFSLALDGISIASMDPISNTSGATRVWVGEGATIGANTFTPTAHAQNTARSSIGLGSVGFVDVDLGTPESYTGHTVEAYIGPAANTAKDPALTGSITVATGGIDLSATSINRATVDEVDIEINAVSVSNLTPEVNVKGATSAHLGGNFAFNADFVNVVADADNRAESSSIQVAVSDVDVDLGKQTSTTEHATAAYIGGEANITGIGVNLGLSAHSDNVATTGGVEVSIGTADVDLVDASSSVKGSTSSYIAEGTDIVVTALSVMASSDNDATANTIAAGLNTASVRKGSAKASTEHTTDAHIGHSAGGARNTELAGTIDVASGVVGVTATSFNDASILDVDVGWGEVDVDMIRPEATAAGTTRAFLGGEYIIDGADVNALADSTNNARSNAVNIEKSGIVAVDIPTTKITTDHTTQAYVAREADIEVDAGGLTLTADSTNLADAGKVGVAIASVDVAKAETTTTAKGATRALIGEGASVDARTLAVTAKSDNDSTADVVLVGVTGVEVHVTDVTATTDHVTEAYIGPSFGNGPTNGLSGGLLIPGGEIKLEAFSTNDANVDDVDIDVGGVNIELIRPEVSVGGATRAFVGGTFGALFTGVNAFAHSINHASSDAVNVELTGVAVDVPTVSVSTAHTTEAFVAGAADIIVDDALTLRAESRSLADAGTVDVTLSGVNVAKSETTMDAGGATRAYIGEGAKVLAETLSVTADSDNDAEAETVFVNATGVHVDVAKATAKTTHLTEAYVGPGAGVAPADGVSGSIQVSSGDIVLHADSTSDANIGAISVEIGGVVIDVVRPDVQVGGTTRAFLGGRFTINASGVTGFSHAVNHGTADAVSIDVAGVIVDLPSTGVETNHTTEAYVASQGDIDVIGGGLTLTADSTNTAEAGRIDVDLAGVDIAVVKPEAEVLGLTRSYVQEGAQIVAGGLSATAHAGNIATVDTHLIGVTGISVEIVRPVAQITHATEAFIGPAVGAESNGLAGSIAVGGGTVGISAVSENDAQINEFSVSVAGIDVETVRPEVTTAGTTLAHLGGTFQIAAGAVNVSANAPNNRAASDIFSLDIGAVNVGVAKAPVKVSHVTESFVAGGANISVTGGPLTFTGSSGNHATADTLDISIGAINVAALSADATVEGATRAYIGGNAVLNADDVSLAAQSTDNSALAGMTQVNVGLIDVVVLNPKATTVHTVEAFVAGGANVTADDLQVGATSVATATADVDTVAVTAFNITSVNPTAQVQGNTKAFVDGAVTTADLTITANAQRTATADTMVVSIGIIGSGAAADSTANVEGDTEVYFGSSSRTTATGNVSANAIVNNRATSKTEGGSGGIVGVGFLDSSTNVKGNTRAFMGAGAQVTQAGNFELQAVGVNTAKTDTLVGTGGVVDVRGAQATAIVTPVVEAFIDNNVSMSNVAGNLTVRADSVRAEGDAVAKSYGGGVVDVGAANADTTANPTVNAFIDTGSNIAVGGGVRVEALARTQPLANLGDTFTPNQNTIDNDTIEFATHGLSNGDVVTYNPNGNAAIATADGGTLQTGREYSVIATGEDTLQLGATFNAQDADTGDLFAPGVGVDSQRDRIRFSVLHLFATGDAVKYDANGALISADLNETGTFFVRKIDDFTIKLYADRNEAIGAGGFADKGFGGSAVDATNDTITISGHGFAQNQAITYRAAPAAEFRGDGVDVDISGETVTENDNDRIYIEGHGFSTGNRVVYRNSANAAALGLTSGTTYFVIVVDANNIQLAASLEATDPDDDDDDVEVTPIELTRDASQAGQSIRHLLVREAIGGLEDGKTYYVTNISGDSFQLSATPGGAAITSLDGSARVGTHFLARTGIELSGQSSLHTLRLDMTSAPGGNHLLLGPDGVSLRTLSPPPGDGQSSASATGGGGGLVATGNPDGVLDATQHVRAFIAPQLLRAGGNVDVLSSASGNTSAYGSNKGGGFVAVGNADAVSHVHNTNLAYIGVDDSGNIVADGVVIEATGHLRVNSNSTLNVEVTSNADGGGFVASVDADSISTVDDDTQAVIGSNATVTARSVDLTAQWSDFHVDFDADATAGGLFGSASATGDGDNDLNVLTAIRGGAVVTGFEGVDVRALLLNVDELDQSDVDGDFFGIGPGTDNKDANRHLSAVIDGDDNALVVAGPRLFPGPGVPTVDETPLEQPSGFDRLALFVQLESPDQTRRIDWDSDVLLLSGPSPNLIVGADGRIRRRSTSAWPVSAVRSAPSSIPTTTGRS